MSNLTAVEINERENTPLELAAPTSEPASEKAASRQGAVAKPKPAKPKPITKLASDNGPIYLLLFSNGKYKELRESELNTEAAGVLKDQTLRLVKGQFLIPQISFKVADEE
ncbi:MAG: hypothetical protein AB7U82_04130 [Blastocatellales bacterium]